MKKVIIRLLVLIILVLFATIIVLSYYSKKIIPVIMEYAFIESKKIGINIISDGINEELSNILKEDSIFSIEKDNNGVIESIDYNTEVVNEILSITSKKVYSNYLDYSTNNKGIITSIPLGMVTNNIFFKNLGPKIPVKIYLDGNVLTSLKTKVKEYGLNSALVQISVRIEANVEIIAPLSSKEIKVINEVPISIKIIKGNISNLLTNKN